MLARDCDERGKEIEQVKSEFEKNLIILKKYQVENSELKRKDYDSFESNNEDAEDELKQYIKHFENTIAINKSIYLKNESEFRRKVI